MSAVQNIIDRISIAYYGLTKDSIEAEIKSIFAQSCYKKGMALYTYNGDSQRYWKLKRYLEIIRGRSYDGQTNKRILII